MTIEIISTNKHEYRNNLSDNLRYKLYVSYQLHHNTIIERKFND